MKLEKAIKGDVVSAVREMLKAAKEVDAAAALLRRGRKRLASMELAVAVEAEGYSITSKDVALCLAEAEAAEVDASELEAGRTKFATLELREATTGLDTEVEFLIQKLSAAIAAGGPKEVLEKAKEKLAKMDPDIYQDMRKEELQAAVALGDVEVIKEKLGHATKAGVEEEDLLAAQQILAVLVVQAAVMPDLVPLEMEGEQLKAALDKTRHGAETGQKAKLDQEEPPLSDVLAQLAALQAEATKRDAHAGLIAASLGTDIKAFKAAIEAAEAAGVDHAVIAKEKEKLN